MTRKCAIRVPQRPNGSSLTLSESSRDRSTSAPNIYEISNGEPALEAVCAHSSVLTILHNFSVFFLTTLILFFRC